MNGRGRISHRLTSILAKYKITTEFLKQLSIYSTVDAMQLFKRLFRYLFAWELSWELLKRSACAWLVFLALFKIRSIIWWIFSFRNPRKRKLFQKLQESSSYSEFRETALELDEMEGHQTWKDESETNLYDFQTIQANLKELRLLSQCEDVRGIVQHLRSRLSRKLGGIHSMHLYAKAHFGTKTLIEEYVDQVCSSLNYVLTETSGEFSDAEKLSFFTETRHSYGRTALFLSGGAGLGLYHMGIIKTLSESKLLPKIISGSSAGSFFAGCLATKTDEEIPAFVSNQGPPFWFFDEDTGANWRMIMRVLQGGGIHDTTYLEKAFKLHIGDYTFAEAYMKTKRIVNILVSPQSSRYDLQSDRILNHVTAPDVLIWSACISSCAIPSVYQPYELMARRNGEVVPYFSQKIVWSDGSFGNDIPTKRLAQLFNVNHSIVAQVNPHTLPFLFSDPLRTDMFLSIAHYAGNRFLHHISNIVQCLAHLLPSFRLSHRVLSQPYLGDIVIYPQVNILYEYFIIMKNPSDERFNHCVQTMQNSTFRHVPIIQNQCCIEYLLDECVHTLRDKMLEESHVYPEQTQTTTISKTQSFSFEEIISTQKIQRKE